MKKWASFLFVVALLVVSGVGCAPALQGIFPIGQIEMGDKIYQWASIKSQDKNGINASTEACISRNKKTGDSKLEYAATGYQTGIRKAVTEQILPAAAEVAKGGLMGPAATVLIPASKVNVLQGQVQGQVQGQGQVIK